MPVYECPSWGCHGEIVTDAEPRHGTVARCRVPEEEDPRRVCRREMVWNAHRLAWQAAPGAI